MLVEVWPVSYLDLGKLLSYLVVQVLLEHLVFSIHLLSAHPLSVLLSKLLFYLLAFQLLREDFFHSIIAVFIFHIVFSLLILYSVELRIIFLLLWPNIRVFLNSALFVRNTLLFFRGVTLLRGFHVERGGLLAYIGFLVWVGLFWDWRNLLKRSFI